MARALPLPPPGFDELSADEKIVYVQALWDRIEAPRENEPVPDWHLEIVRERLAEYEADPDSGNITMEELIAMLDEPLDSSSK
ncbi:MAG TPA: addiction module protein [Thermoanaerobaculia bacterium]|nr:addiction module protein [Thermoanaerobaculia bacterium]